MDRWRRKPFLLLGALIFTLASFSYSFATSVPALYLVRAFHGAGIACFTTAAATYIADIVPAARRGVAMGFYGTFSNIAMSIGPFLGGMFMRGYGLATLFGTSAATGLASLAVVSLLREPARAPSHAVRPRHARPPHQPVGARPVAGHVLAFLHLRRGPQLPAAHGRRAGHRQL